MRFNQNLISKPDQNKIEKHMDYRRFFDSNLPDVSDLASFYFPIVENAKMKAFPFL